MNKTIVSVLGLMACVLSAQAQYFTNGNLVVVNVGGPGETAGQGASSANFGQTVSLLQYTTSAGQSAPVSTLTLPTTGANAFTLSGGFTEGYCSLSPNGLYLVVPGYNSAIPLTGGPAGSNSVTAPRSIALIDGYGNYTLPIANTNIFSTYNIRGAAFDGTNNFWACGSGAPALPKGILYVGTNGSDGTQVQVGITGTGNERCLSIYNNTLYVSTGSTTKGIWAITGPGSSPPTTGVGTNAVNTIAMGTGTVSPYDFVFDPANTTCYVADSDFGIIKFTNNAGTWGSNYTLSAATTGFPTQTAVGVTADFTQNPPVIYATTGETISNRLISIMDSGPTATGVLLAQAAVTANATNYFHGVRFVPSSVPMITSQPLSASVSASGTANFSVSATGSPAPAYQWYINGVAVSGATASAFSVYPVTTFESGTVVSVVVSNAYGVAVSSNATLTVNPVYFTPGNLVVVSVGGPGQYINATDSGNTVSILQFTTNAGQSGPVSTLSLPSSGPSAFLLDGSATEGYCSLSPNGQYLVLAGYNASYPYSSAYTNVLEYSQSTNAPRSVAMIDGYGNYSLPIANTNIYNTYNIRGAAFDGVSNFWVSGGGAPANPKGVFYVGPPGSTGVNVLVGETGTGNERCLNIFNDTLYVGTGSSTHGIWAITGPSSPPPPIGPPTNTPVNTIPENTSTGPYDFAINAANNIAYVADGNLGGIIRFTDNGTGWTSNCFYSVGANAGGLTADFTQTPPVIYATTSELAGNRLISIVDNGYGSPFTVLAQASSSGAGSNYFRGVRMVPGVPPTITAQPADFVQDAGGDATFAVSATGTPVLGFQWYTNGTLVAGATTSGLTLNDVTLAQSNTLVSVVVSNAFGTATSSNATLSVQPAGAPLNVSISPGSQTVSAGSSVTLNVSAVGTALTYYWYQNGNPVATTVAASLVISPAFATADGTYTVVASNSFSTAASQNSATVTVIDPVILVQPVGSTNLPGGSAMLSVTAAGDPTLTYQWRSNGVAISGATVTTLNLANGGASVSASYTVVVTNGLGNSVTSGIAVVAFSPYLLYETFSYPNGNLFAESPWTDINGTNPEAVTNGRAQINPTNATTDAQRLFAQPEIGTVMWASFNVNLTTLPTSANGTYFANLEDTNFGFYARVFTLTSNAYPGTYRLGIANNANDYSTTANTGPSAVVPLDLAPGINYEVVLYYDMNNNFSGLAINPANYGDAYVYYQTPVNSGPALDSYSPSGLPMAAFGLRQRQGEGVLTMGNLEVSFDYSGTGSGYAAVTAGLTPAKPVIGFQPQGVTNYSGNNYVMEVAASGIGAPGVGLGYYWYQNNGSGATLLTDAADGGTVSGSATAALTLTGLQAVNSGTYYVIVSNSAGTVQSSNAIVSVITANTAPFFTVQPLSSTNALGSSVTFTAAASGTGPITYQWYFDGPGNPLSDNGTTIIGSQTASLTLSDLLTNEAGTYTVIATGGTSLQTTSSNAVLTVTPPASVTIGYLRSLLNPTTFEPSDTVDLFTITGTITTFTNLTSGNTASYYIQDSTGGLNLFLTDGSTFRPMIGDIVTATGVLSSYADNFEIDITYGSAVETAVILTNLDGSPMTNALPKPIILPWGYVAANQNYVEINIEGSRVMLTNVYFEVYGADFVPGTTYAVTNNSGQTFDVFLSAQDTNLNNVIVPKFAYSVTAPLAQDDTVFELELSDASEVVTNPPPAPTVSASVVGVQGTNTVTLTWTAVPYQYAYDVLFSTNLAGPWSSLASGLTFTNTLGTYTDALRTDTARYYEIVSP